VEPAVGGVVGSGRSKIQEERGLNFFLLLLFLLFLLPPSFFFLLFTYVWNL
jgi:hypothetical protein